ncbi:MAG: regulatory protein [Patescibacteria group bacterium]|jgi:regulatory protein|nr:regulatory protein [Patescibacteria group bacterium]
MDNFEKYYTAAVSALARRPHSVTEVRDILHKKYKKWNNPEDNREVVDHVIEKLISQKYLDDISFGEWWRDQRTRFKMKSDRLIKFELQRKGLSKESIEKAFSKQSEDSLSDVDKAKKLILKRITKLEHLTKKEKFQKLASYLTQRGFDYDVIRKSIDDSLANEV